MEIVLLLSLACVFTCFSFMACGLATDAEFMKIFSLKSGGSIPETVVRHTKRLSLLNEAIKHPLAKRYRGHMEKLIRKAGLPYMLTPGEMLSLKEVAGVVSGIIIIAACGRINPAILVPFMLAGFFYPDLWLLERFKSRERQVLRDLPYMVDMLALCVEAGMDFTAAIARIAAVKSGLLCREFKRFSNELKLGMTRREALEMMEKRVGVEEFTNFTFALISADEMGTGISGTLKALSEEIRDKVASKLEKKASEAPVKILFPLIGFIFPAIFIIIFGPIIIAGIF